MALLDDNKGDARLVVALYFATSSLHIAKLRLQYRLELALRNTVTVEDYLRWKASIIASAECLTQSSR